MIETKFKITYPFGLHARPATMLVGKANSFQCDMVLECDDRRINMKSIMGVLSLGIPQNKVFKIIFSGADERQAQEAITRIIADINQL